MTEAADVRARKRHGWKNKTIIRRRTTMRTDEAVLQMKRLYPNRTFLVQRSFWHLDHIPGDAIIYLVALFNDAGDVCRNYEGKTLDECLRKVREAEDKKEAVL
jgi:hypothetical protein